MEEDLKTMDDSYAAMRERYGVESTPDRRMGKYGPISENQKPDFFDLRTQLVSEGRNIKPLAETDNLWAWIKVYATGGENTLHGHKNEDHMFIVLSGEATFIGPEGEKKVCGPNQGIMLPAATLYSFCCTSEDPLVLLRVGAQAGDGDLRDRVDENGDPLPGGSKKNKFKPPVYSDQYFG